MKYYTKGILSIHTAILLVGLTGLFAKFINHSSEVIVFSRVVLASITLFVILKFRKRSLAIGETKNILKIITLGFLLSIHWYTFFESIKVSTVAIGLLTFSTFPLFVTFLEPVFFREKLQKIDILIALIVFAGLALVIPSFELKNNMTQGALLGIVSGFSYALLSILNRELVRTFRPMILVFYQSFFAMIFLFPFAAFGTIPSFSFSDAALLIILGVVCTALAHTLIISGLEYVRAQTASIITSLEPLYGIVFAYFFLNEIPALRTIAGGIFILGGVFITTIQHRRISNIT